MLLVNLKEFDGSCNNRGRREHKTNAAEWSWRREEWAEAEAEAALGLYHDNSVIDLINHD